MKICFIVGTLGRGGAEKQLLYMLHALRNCEIECRLLSLTKNEPYESEIKAMGLKIEWIGSHKNRGLRLFAIIRSLKKDPVDIIQSSHFYTNIYAGIAGKVTGIPSIGAVRSDLKSEMKLHGALGRYQVSLPDFLIVNSGLAYRRTIEYGVAPEKVEHVNNVVEKEDVQPDIPDNTDDQIGVLFVGRLDENKRPEAFIDLAARVLKSHPDLNIQFQIAGDGELRSQLEKTSKALNLVPDRIEFLGVCSNMSAIYDRGDILISTSLREGTSNVILEAMAHGLAVVATRSGGTPEILNEDRGILVDPDNADELYSATSKLILDAELRKKLGINGRKYALSEHSLKYLEKQLPAIYKRLI